MSGAEAVRTLREEGYTGFLIGLCGGEDMVDAFKECGVDALIDKPIDASKLRGILETHGLKCSTSCTI